MRTLNTAILAIALMLSACAGLKTVARTVNDVARDACMVFGAKQGERELGMTVKDFCAIERNVHPFIDALLSAQKLSAAKLSARKTEEAKP